MMEESPDLISSLPTEILNHIISMISFKEAVQTSTLSTSWRSLFSPFRINIEQDWGHPNTPQAQNMLKQNIRSFLQSGENFKLYLSLFDRLFAIATKGAHGELHLNFLTQKQLEKVPYDLSMILEQSSLFCPSFAYVKILQLKSVSNLVGNLVNDLILSCQNLESLKLENCPGLENLEIKSNGCLKSFEMADCPNIVGVVISAENLSFFSYKGAYAIIQLVDVPNLVGFALNLRDGLVNKAFDCEDALDFLSSVKDVEILTISSWLLEAFCCSGVIFNKLDFKFSKLKDLRCICTKMSSKTRDSLACFLSMTPSLEQLFVEINETWVASEFPLCNQYWHEPHLWKDYATVKGSAYQLKDLKAIKIVGFKGEKDELLLLDLLLHIAINLKDMIVDSWRVSRIPYSQLTHVKMKYVLISCPETDYYFVLTEAKNYGFKSQIVHYL